MRNTVSVKGLLLLAAGVVLISAGCAAPAERGPSLGEIQRRVRERMLDFQAAELLSGSARERYEPRMASLLLARESGYRESLWNAGNDPALQALENALAYAFVVSSDSPPRTARELAGAALDFAVARRVAEMKRGGGDAAAELAMMTDWSVAEVRRWSGAPLPKCGSAPFPVYPEAEQLLGEYGSAVSFRVAADLYRVPSAGNIRRAERLRRAILNRYLMQTKSPGAADAPELVIAALRGKLFAGEFSLL